MRGRKTDWAGAIQGELMVIKQNGKDKHGSIIWECICSCGGTIFKTSNMLHQGVKSCSPKCGVTKSNITRAKHGQARDSAVTKLYSTWTAMKHRCTNPKHTSWKRYGGRGISVCQEWIDSFETFSKDVGEPPTSKHTLDRIDNNKGYQPDNVRWATRKEQSNNISSNTWIEYEGKRMTWAQWAEYLGVRYNCLMTRVRDKTDLKDILVMGNKPRGRPKNED